MNKGKTIRICIRDTNNCYEVNEGMHLLDNIRELHSHGKHGGEACNLKSNENNNA